MPQTMAVNINIWDCCKRRKKPKLIWTIGPVKELNSPFPKPSTPVPFTPSSKESIVANFQMTDSQQVVLTISAADKRGNPVPSTALNNVTWSVDNPNVLAVNANGATCTASSQGPLGDATVTVNASLPDGTAATGSLAFTIIAGAPVNITVTPGTPTEQP